MSKALKKDDLPDWDLSTLYSHPQSDQIDLDLEKLDKAATSFQENWQGRINGLEAGQFTSLIGDYEEIVQSLGRLGSYAQLVFATDRQDHETGKFYTKIHEKTTEISNRLIFLSLEINELSDDQISAVLAYEGLDRYSPWFHQIREFKPFQLTQEVEQTLHQQSVTGRSAWVRLFDETMAGLRFDLDGEFLTSAEIFNKFTDKDRSLRKRAAHSIASTLKSNVPLLLRINNTLLKDKAIDDERRGFARPISRKNLSNQVEDDVVDALINTVSSAYPKLSHRYYKIKARLLGLDQLEYWDRNAPLPMAGENKKSWMDAKVVVLDAYRKFSPKLGSIVEEFFDRQWIDAAPKPGKDSGAFCHPTVPDANPFVLMNYQGKNRDIMTLAHELGHGVHQYLSREQGILLAYTPLTLAETASVFGEQLTFQSLLEVQSSPDARIELLASKIEDMLNTVVRQIAFCQFEIAVHEQRKKGELSEEDFAAIWMRVQSESLGPAINLAPEYDIYWSYIPHFIHSPFYVYAYAFGDCLVNSLYGVYQEKPDGFEPLYLEMLRAGGTKRHGPLLEPFGLDCRDPAFWQYGIKVIESFIDQLDDLLAKKGVNIGSA